MVLGKEQEALRAKCAERGVEVRFVAEGMERRRRNATVWNRKDDELRWRLEWVFHIDGARVVRIDESAGENATLSEFYAAHVRELTLAVENKPSMAPFKLAAFKEKDGFCVFTEEFGTPANAKLWHAIDVHDAIATALRGKTVIEFPTFHVVPSSARADFALAPDPSPAQSDPRTDV